MDYLKIGRADELKGPDKRLYRALEILPGFLSWVTLLFLIVMSFIRPVMVAYILIAFDVYWLLLVVYLAIHLLASYKKIRENTKTNWPEKCLSLDRVPDQCKAGECLSIRGMKWQDIIHLVIFPIYDESDEVISQSVAALLNSGYPGDNIIIVLSAEGRAGQEAEDRILRAKTEFGSRCRLFFTTVHPDGTAGEIKGKGANQAWAAKQIKKEYIDKENIDRRRIIVSVFDIDTVIYPYYLYALAYSFLTAANPYRTSYQPVPVFNNNVWQAPFFARVAAASNTFWQMMQQIRQEKLATFSSHSMTWQALEEVGFWSTNMVSEDSRIFWHCFCYYNGDYKVEPLYYPVSMDVCMDETAWQTAKNLYRQQRRWGWGVENIPYLVFNTIKKWREIPRGRFLNRIFVQMYGFHSWATNALIIGVIGWMPVFFGGERFNVSVLSSNLPVVTRSLMTIAMVGLVVSALLSTLLLPPRPKKYGLARQLAMIGQWIVLPVSIIIFGAIPGLEAQTRLMLGGRFRLGFFVTPKKR